MYISELGSLIASTTISMPISSAIAFNTEFCLAADLTSFPPFKGLVLISSKYCSSETACATLGTRRTRSLPCPVVSLSIFLPSQAGKRTKTPSTDFSTAWGNAVCKYVVVMFSRIAFLFCNIKRSKACAVVPVLDLTIDLALILSTNIELPNCFFKAAIKLEVCLPSGALWSNLAVNDGAPTIRDTAVLTSGIASSLINAWLPW